MTADNLTRDADDVFADLQAKLVSKRHAQKYADKEGLQCPCGKVTQIQEKQKCHISTTTHHAVIASYTGRQFLGILPSQSGDSWRRLRPASPN